MSRSGEHLKDEGSKTQVVIAGAVAGLIARFVIAPLDVVKIRLQLQTHSLSDPLSQQDLKGSPIYKGTLPTLRHILRDEGITGLWKGNIPAELMYVAYSAIQFTTYRSVTLGLQSAFGEHRLPAAAESFIAGASAGAVSTTATYPLDLLRTRFAAQGRERIYTSLAASIREIAKNEGPRGFFQGLGAGVGQIIPYMGIFFATYETLRKPMSSLQLPFGSGEAMAGVLASLVSKTAVFPLDLVRKRLQVQGPTRAKYVHKNIPVYKGVIRTLQSILKKEGTRGLYRGLTVSLFKAAPASAVTMWTYERVLRVMMDMEVAKTE
ncbi:mitochondrial thiamine pyrophosphate carrier 1 [Mollisia scopiformis]|uniref:Mitochondrial thiamine pyrophosphate carrier 1 n=1 Tax=Mollisia scopiformis TaxID=149040 RepID=A0A132B7J7_MOLSC|nr:mitochondrial thiamine pyrophosphate carrier 1 [Mollisia scopiformis]KUJ08385.1 mitochondrial thiamine pyrophosphate carrier 1 [Mollisia scopiformis]